MEYISIHYSILEYIIRTVDVVLVCRQMWWLALNHLRIAGFSV